MLIEDLKDVRPPVELPPNYFWIVFVLLSLLLLGIYFFVRWLLPKIRKRKEIPIIIRSAWEIAKEELSALEKENLPARGQIEEYFVRLSAIVRHYLEERFSVSAPEMTTDEFLLYLKEISILNNQQKDALKDFLIISDMVKFARYSSSIVEMSNAFAVAQKLVVETTPALAITEIKK